MTTAPPTRPALTTPPDSDELEITLLGRGFGECVIVHLLGDEWMVVDSFNDHKQGGPVALSYLASINVDPQRVRTLVITHFDADHYRGIDILHERCPNARLLTTQAVESKHPAFGWQAVVDEPNHRHLQRSDVVKVAHHGSDDAHHDPMWDALVNDGAVLMVAPFWTQGRLRPADIERLTARGTLWQAAPSLKHEHDEFGNRVSLEPLTGMVQARKRPGEAWRVQTAPPAFSWSVEQDGLVIRDRAGKWLRWRLSQEGAHVLETARQAGLVPRKGGARSPGRQAPPTRAAAQR